MVLVHIINSLSTGGAEIILKEIVTEISNRHPEIEQKVVTLFEDGPVREMMPSSVDCICLNVSKSSFFFRTGKFRQWLIQHRVNAIHSHLYESTIFARLSCPSGIKIISTYHSPMHDPSLQDHKWYRLLLDRWTIRADHQIIFVSKKAAEVNVKALQRKFQFLQLDNFTPSGIEPLPKTSTPGQFNLISIGRLVDQKNFSLSIEALSGIDPNQINLDIYGIGPIKAKLQQQISSANSPIQLKGLIKTSSQLLANYDCFVMTSKFEGMPISLLEALASGLPCILTNVPELSDTAGSAAIYFNGDNPTELRHQILSLANDHALQKKLSEQAIAQAKLRTAEQYVAKLMTLYRP